VINQCIYTIKSQKQKTNKPTKPKTHTHPYIYSPQPTKFDKLIDITGKLILITLEKEQLILKKLLK